MGDNIKWLSELSKKDSLLAGDKATNLAEMYNSKLPIPQAFVITSPAIQEFLKTTKIQDTLNKINTDNASQLQEKSKEIQNLILSTPLPEQLQKEILEAYDHFNVDLNEIRDSPRALAILKSAREPVFVSIRNSTAEKQNHNSFLNIKGNKEIIQKIKECTAFKFTPESIISRKEKGQNALPKIAIIIQQMINADKSGTIYSQNPTNKEEILIKSIFGLGKGLNSKEIKPDQYTLSQDLEITSEQITNKEFALTRTSEGTNRLIKLEEEKSSSRVLKTHQIKELAQYAQNLEQQQETPQELEFSIEDNTIYLLGTKPITKQQSNEIKKILPTKTKIKISLNSSNQATSATTNSPEGIIIETEALIQKHPLEYQKQNQLDQYQKDIETELQKIITTFPKKPIWIKSFNSSTKEKNPLLEDSGIRFSLKNKEIFKREIKALNNIAKQNSKIGLLLSQITSPEEILQTKQLLQKLNAQDLKLGIAIETPAAAILIKDICEAKIDFITFQLENLTQYTLATTKESETYNETSWAILKQISRVTRECKKQNIETSIYKETPYDTTLLKFLLKQKIDSITTSPNQAHQLSELIQQLENETQETFDNKQEIEKEIEETKQQEKPTHNLNPEPTEEISDTSNAEWEEVKEEKPKKEKIFE